MDTLTELMQGFIGYLCLILVAIWITLIFLAIVIRMLVIRTE